MKGKGRGKEASPAPQYSFLRLPMLTRKRKKGGKGGETRGEKVTKELSPYV